MYKKTDSQQSLFGVETQLNASLKARLNGSWAQLFRSEILAILLRSEDQFAMLYGQTDRQRGCDLRNSKGQFRLEITAKLRLRDQMYADQQTDAWKQRYKIRSGIEATMSELKRSHGMGKLRVRRAAKVSFAVACKVIACNIKRWAKAYEGPTNALQRLFHFILGFIGPIEAIFKEQCQSWTKSQPCASR